MADCGLLDTSEFGLDCDTQLLAGRKNELFCNVLKYPYNSIGCCRAYITLILAVRESGAATSASTVRPFCTGGGYEHTNHDCFSRNGKRLVGKK